jgi:LmbE family N-acetylglucosaminyl deacetylase
MEKGGKRAAATGGVKMFGRRILILVPHPDDEVVACAAAIGHARATGAEVFALYLTHGCLARETLWPWQRKQYDKFVACRRAEAEKTAVLLSVSPLGWSPRPARHLWRHLPEVYEEIRLAIRSHDIDQLWVPAYEGGNADHDAANAVASLLKTEDRGQRTNLESQKGNPPSVVCPPLSVLEFAEYNFAGGKTHSQEFPTANGSEQIIALTPEEKKIKREALTLYKSERGNLGYVKTGRECYRPLANYDYTLPAHPGTLWYARFQWVPFHHPRVDFTKPEEVSRAIASLFGHASA